MKASIKDIAVKLGISTAVVSLVLNGKEKESRISIGTAQKIRELAAELNYSPNRFAKGLKKGKSNILGLIVADISNPFFAKLTRYIEDEAEKYGYKIIIGSSDENPKKMASLIDVMKTYHVDGFLIVPPDNSQDQIRQLIHENFALVLIDRYFQNIAADTLLIDNYETSFKATEYLIKSGCKNIAAFIYDSDLLHFKDRLKGYKDAIKSHKLLLKKDSVFFIRFKHIIEDMEKSIDKLINNDQKHDGLVFFTDTLAIKGIAALRRLKTDIRKSFKIVSFDENETFSFLNFPVPHFSQPLYEFGKNAVQLVTKQIENKSSSEPKKIIFKAKWFDN